VAPRYLLDTSVLSDLVRHPQGVIAAHVAQEGEEAVCTSIVVAGELRFGAAKRSSPRLTAQLEAVLSALEVLPLEEPADRRYGELRSHLERQGAPIGPNDMLIAAHALALGLTVVTDNTREFSRVPGLRVENWLET
jgi:tRNA(fMet)-specific endonuclease VapC